MRNEREIQERLLQGDFTGARRLHEQNLIRITRNERLMIAAVIVAAVIALTAPFLVKVFKG